MHNILHNTSLEADLQELQPGMAQQDAGQHGLEVRLRHPLALVLAQDLEHAHHRLRLHRARHILSTGSPLLLLSALKVVSVGFIWRTLSSVKSINVVTDGIARWLTMHHMTSRLPILYL